MVKFGEFKYGEEKYGGEKVVEKVVEEEKSTFQATSPETEEKQVRADETLTELAEALQWVRLNSGARFEFEYQLEPYIRNILRKLELI